MQNTYSLKELATLLDAKLKGNAEAVITGLATIENAESGHVTFLLGPKYQKNLKTTKASAVVLMESDSVHCPVDALIVKNPYLSYAKLASLFNYTPSVKPGIHPTAIIGEHCHISESASIGPHTVIENNVSIGENTVIGVHCIIEEGVIIGRDCHFNPQVTLHHHVKVGNKVRLHSGVVIGSDGFGNVNDDGKWVKIPQIGSVIIGNDVEIGANSTVDRGAIGDTVIEEGVKIDNLVMIAHNVVVGAHTAMAGCSAIAGSTKVGKHCVIAGQVGISDHLDIGPYVTFTARAFVTKSIQQPGVYSSGTTVQPHRQWQKNVARFHQLDEIARRLRQLEVTKDE